MDEYRYRCARCGEQFVRNEANSVHYPMKEWGCGCNNTLEPKLETPLKRLKQLNMRFEDIKKENYELNKENQKLKAELEKLKLLYNPPINGNAKDTTALTRFSNIEQ